MSALRDAKFAASTLTLFSRACLTAPFVVLPPLRRCPPLLAERRRTRTRTRTQGIVFNIIGDADLTLSEVSEGSDGTRGIGNGVGVVAHDGQKLAVVARRQALLLFLPQVRVKYLDIFRGRRTSIYRTCLGFASTTDTSTASRFRYWPEEAQPVHFTYTLAIPSQVPLHAGVRYQTEYVLVLIPNVPSLAGSGYFECSTLAIGVDTASCE